ncbi:MAG: PAS domain-containing protein [Gemmatimonadota bacterium]
MEPDRQSALNDPDRIDALRRLGLMDTLPEEAFDRLTRIAARTVGAPIALVNLIDDERQFFKSAVGMGTLRELPVATGVCSYALASRQPLLIEDARLEPRFAGNPIVTDHGLVAYIGMPLLTEEGHAIGTFCVVDTKPHTWTEQDVETIRDLAATLMTEIGFRQVTGTLESERARLATIFEQAPAFMASLRGPEHVFEMANAPYQQLIGHRPVLGLPVHEALPEVVPQGIIELLDRVYRTGEPFRTDRMTILLQREVGAPMEQRILRFGYLPLKDPDGSVSGLLAHGIDVTEQVRASERVEAAEEHYRRLVDNSPLAIFSLDHEGLFTQLNPAGEAILGRPVADVLGRHFAEMVHASDHAQADEAFREVLEGHVDQRSVDLQVHRPNLELRRLAITCTGIRERGELVGVQGIARDVTEERLREQQIRLLAAALENLDEGVSITRTDGQLLYANANLGRLLNFDIRAPLPNSASFVADEPDREAFETIAATVAAKGIWRGRTKFMPLGGDRSIPMHLVIGTVAQDDGEVLYFSIARDIRGEIERETNLRRTERLASIGTLIGGFAHKLNNPLHAIQGLAELLAVSPGAPTVKEDLESIQREALRAARIVADLKDLAGSTHADGSNEERVDLNDVLRQALGSRHFSLNSRNVEIVEELEEQLPLVLGNHRQLQQVFLNLILNAEEAMERSPGERRLVVRTRAAAGRVEVAVIDTGGGIPPEHLERIFDPFWTTKAPRESTGLGLSLVQTRVAEHGGSVRVESTPGEGAAFFIHLPCLTDRMPAPEAPAPQETATPDPLRILLVDDEPTVRSGVSRYLAGRGHHVDLAVDGGDALRMVADADAAGLIYDVIVSDLRMPGLAGDELFARLRDAGGGLERRFIFMTGDALGGDTTRVLAELGAPVLFKPISLRKAAAQIEGLAARTAGLDPRSTRT